MKKTLTGDGQKEMTNLSSFFAETYFKTPGLILQDPWAFYFSSFVLASNLVYIQALKYNDARNRNPSMNWHLPGEEKQNVR